MTVNGRLWDNENFLSYRLPILASETQDVVLMHGLGQPEARENAHSLGIPLK